MSQPKDERGCRHCRLAAVVAVLFALACITRAGAFSLLGPFQNQANGAADPWQGAPYGGRLSGLGYNLPGDIGGPMLIQESYRWNIPVITYGFDAEFIEYFGQAGVEEVEKAVAMFNALPPASQMTATLEEFPLDTKGVNLLAESNGLLHLQSFALALLLEQLGLAPPERFTWCLRSRAVSTTGTNYAVMNLNYDAETGRPSRQVNGVNYNYLVFDSLGRFGEEWASALEWYELDFDKVPYSSVAGSLNSRDFVLGSYPADSPSSSVILWAGQYFTGLTRDDIGGLRFLLSRENRRVETLLPGVTGANGSNFVNVARRPGVEKLTFQRLPLDPATGQFRPVTNVFSDVYYTDEMAATQTLQRVVTTPDILFRVRDLGGEVFNFQHFASYFTTEKYERTGTSGWKNHAALNDRPGGGGPGVIQPPIQIDFSKLGRYGGTADGVNYSHQWGAFDGSDSPPVWFHGRETNLTLVVESRLVRTNSALQFEWTTLRARQHPYRIEVSTNLVDWTFFTRFEPSTTDGGNAFTLRHPVGQVPRFFRAIKEPELP